MYKRGKSNYRVTGLALQRHLLSGIGGINSTPLLSFHLHLLHLSEPLLRIASLARSVLQCL